MRRNDRAEVFAEQFRVFADGSVRSLSESMTPASLAAIVTRAGREPAANLD